MQHRNKATATKNRTKSKGEKSNIGKKTNATMKNYLLHQQNKATTTTKKQSAMRDVTIRKKTNATKKNTCCSYCNNRNKAQCELQHQKKKLMQRRKILVATAKQHYRNNRNKNTMRDAT